MKGNRNFKKWGQAAGVFALGATAGSAAALLLAPASGRTSRKKLALKFRSMGRTAARGLQQSKKLLAKKAEGWKDATVERLGDTREWLMERIPSGNSRHHPRPRRAARC
jgi:gas vesicle protein